MLVSENVGQGQIIINLK